MNDENKYYQALDDLNKLNLSKKKWLLDNFNLYKKTLNWPDNLPPINRSNLVTSPHIEKFNISYKSILLEFDYRFDNEKKILELK
jgi:hypothetical protein